MESSWVLTNNGWRKVYGLCKRLTRQLDRSNTIINVISREINARRASTLLKFYAFDFRMPTCIILFDFSYKKVQATSLKDQTLHMNFTTKSSQIYKTGTWPVSTNCFCLPPLTAFIDVLVVMSAYLMFPM